MSAYLLPLALLIIGGILYLISTRMKRSIEDTPIVFIGAGNLATNLAKALYRKGFRIVQVYCPYGRFGPPVGRRSGSGIYYSSGRYKFICPLYIDFAERFGCCGIASCNCVWEAKRSFDGTYGW